MCGRVMVAPLRCRMGNAPRPGDRKLIEGEEPMNAQRCFRALCWMVVLPLAATAMTASPRRRRDVVEPELYYSPAEAAELLGVHIETVRRWLRAGSFPTRVVHPGGRYLIPATDFDAYLAGQES